MLRKTEQIVAAVLFASAGAVLAIWGRGPLVWPGVVISLLGVLGCLAGRIIVPAAAGSLAAGISLFAQSRWGVCPDCILSACLLGIGSITAIMKDVPQKPALALLVLPMLAGAICLAVQIEPASPTVPLQAVTQSHERKTSPETVKPSEETKAMLYFSPWCSHCEKTVRSLARLDPEGRTWRPVIVPCSGLAEGEAELARAGYTGRVECAGESPEYAIPCLVTGTQTLVGDNRIQEWISRKAGSNQ